MSTPFVTKANAQQRQAIASLPLTPNALFICRDAALTDDLAANSALQRRLKTI
jgi:hypothetical protein